MSFYDNPTQYNNPNPSAYQPPQKPPSRIARIRQQFMSLRKSIRIGIGCLVALMLVFSCGICSAAFSAGNSNQATVTTPTSTHTSATAATNHHVTTAPTRIPPKPTMTPTPTPVPTQAPTEPPVQPTVAPTQAPPAQPSCYPLTSSGNCYEAGEYCPKADHGSSGIAGNGESITCEDNDGWRWEPSN
jgi:cytoskeletal protein RodZ